MSSRTAQIGRALIEWAKSVFLGVFFFLFVVRPFILQAYHVPTGSMENTLMTGDFLLVNKAAFGGCSPRHLPFFDVEIPRFRLPGYEEPSRGDILVFEYPYDRSQDFVKRCVALGGDTVEMRDKVLYVNGVRQEEPFARHADNRVRRDFNRLYDANIFAWQFDYLIGDDKREAARSEYRPTRDNFGPLIVPAGKYFCLGDNRDSSSDSRFWGFVDREMIRGRPLMLYFSWDKERKLPRFDRIAHIVQ